MGYLQKQLPVRISSSFGQQQMTQDDLIHIH